MSDRKQTGRLLAFFLNAAATLQLVWFYLALVPSYLDLRKYELGQINTPFQHRLLMMWPLRLAHASAACQHLSATLSAANAWFPYGVKPEQLAEFPIDVLAVATAGLVARSLYRASSRTGALTPFVYPLTLLMVLSTYALNTMHRLAFVYDLPSLGFFAAGMYLIYFRRSRWLFALLFVVATVNRETTLFLLVLYAFTAALDARQSRGAKLGLARIMPHLAMRDWVVLAGLLGYWAGWHVWVVRHFAANGSESFPRFWLNIGILLWPTSWLQLASCFAFCGPLFVLRRKAVQDATLRAWLWLLPLWIVFMLHYGLLLETRIFGELIPYAACLMALIAERAIVGRLSPGVRATVAEIQTA